MTGFQKTAPKRNLYLLAPVFGSILFVLFYAVATRLYPGGGPSATGSGFRWAHHYWCNLLAERSLSGVPNAARPLAIAGMGVLVASIGSFWFIYSGNTPLRAIPRRVIRISGTASMVAVIFLSSAYHDMVINISASLGLVALGVILKSLYDLRWITAFYIGTLIPLLVALNNLLYYNAALIRYLPVVQKITFLYFLFWMCLVTVAVYKKRGNK
jgi:hypothetical protein